MLLGVVVTLKSRCSPLSLLLSLFSSFFLLSSHLRVASKTTSLVMLEFDEKHSSSLDALR
jgi:hypothetical protein